LISSRRSSRRGASSRRPGADSRGSAGHVRGLDEELRARILDGCRWMLDEPTESGDAARRSSGVRPGRGWRRGDAHRITGGETEAHTDAGTKNAGGSSGSTMGGPVFPPRIGRSSDAVPAPIVRGRAYRAPLSSRHTAAPTARRTPLLARHCADEATRHRQRRRTRSGRAGDSGRGTVRHRLSLVGLCAVICTVVVGILVPHSDW
jgi:hypothetical protein